MNSIPPATHPRVHAPSPERRWHRSVPDGDEPANPEKWRLGIRGCLRSQWAAEAPQADRCRMLVSAPPDCNWNRSQFQCGVMLEAYPGLPQNFPRERHAPAQHQPLRGFVPLLEAEGLVRREKTILGFGPGVRGEVQGSIAATPNA